MESVPVKKKTRKEKVYKNEVLRTIYERRAVRKFSDRKVSRELISELLDAGRMAPSAINRQPWRFFVLTDPERIKTISKQIRKAAAKHFLKTGIKEIVKNAESLLHFPAGLKFISEKDPVFHSAPLVIFITSPSNNEWSDLDTGMCAQNMMLAARSLGLDSCPVGFGKFVDKTNSYPELGVPRGERVNISLVFGYGEENPEAHPRITDNAVFL